MDFSSVDFGRIFSTVLDVDFGWFCPGLQFTVKRPACLCFWPLGALFKRFGNFGTQLAVCSMPALLKCDVALFVLDAILDVYLTVNFGVVWTSILDSFLSTFWPRWRETICLYMGVFWIWGVGPDLFLAHFWTVLLPTILEVNLDPLF